MLEEIAEDDVHKLVAVVAGYQMTIPRLEEMEVTKEQLEEDLLEKWKGLKEWFLGREGRESELYFLQHQTNEAIRRMTRVVQRLGERHHNFRSRKKDFLHLAKWFSELPSLENAHRFSSVVFGCFHTKHLITENDATENFYRDIWEEAATEWTVKPRVRHYREKKKPEAIETHEKEKQEMKEKFLLEKKQEKEELENLIQGNKIVLRELPVIEPHIRKTLLSWIAKSMTKQDGVVKTENGWKVKILQKDASLIELKAADGTLTMPNYELYVLEKGEL
ncbi:hypothetical protein AT864_02581 [Anoxybacillus sp. P3H1B]|nr:hypothetical protein AT864_02581 [Anoxybacillus sp. P3H1B]